MKTLMDFLADLMGALLRLVFWLVTVGLALGMLGLAVVVLVVGSIWALLRGQRPRAPVMMGRFTQFTSERVWRGPGWPRPDAAAASDVVDVEARDVAGTGGHTLPPRP